MNKRRLELITTDYWQVSYAVRHPEAPTMTVGDALTQLNSSDRLRPEEWRLQDLMHVITFDLIEGNTKWRSKSTRHTKG